MTYRYENIVRAIYTKANRERLDVRDIIRQWIVLFEYSRVTGWNRDHFLDCCIKVSESYSVKSGRVKTKMKGGEVIQ